MVLQSKRVNLENAPPSFSTHGPVKSIASRIRTSIHDPSRRRRARTARGSKYAVEQAKRKSKTKSPPATVEFQVTTLPTPQSGDIEMGEVEQPALVMQNYRLPRELSRPEFTEISSETLIALEPELAEDLPDLEYMRDAIEDFGPGLLRAVTTVAVADLPKDSLPAEVVITINDHSDYPPPTHMLALFSLPKDLGSTARRQVTLMPTHTVVLALHCARLPKFSSPSPTPAYTSDDRTQLVVPVQPLGVPSPASFPLLSAFLYTKRADSLLKSLLPCPPPAALDDDRTLLPSFAARLAATYTGQALILNVLAVHGLWKNACVLGVFVDELWDTIDLAWEVLLTAIAISVGMPQLMLKRPSSPKPPVASGSGASTPTATALSASDGASTPTPTS
ncbi:hypothetical protein C8J57DRAFT_1429666 [Mycena rebaudengoi]|nr:hypothetical protein C8J57DRAFT_1429666 [Mycena rebaudengoi]